MQSLKKFEYQKKVAFQEQHTKKHHAKMKQSRKINQKMKVKLLLNIYFN